jgi:hypothetical protein
MPAEPLPGARLIRDRWDQLAAESPFQWVAATADEIVSRQPDLAEVIGEVVRRDLVGQVVFAFINVGRLVEE